MPNRDEVVSRLYNEGWAREDFDVVFECLDPSIVWTAIERAPDAGTYRGHEGARAYIQDWLDDFRDFHWEILETIEVDDRRIVCMHTARNTSRRTRLSPPHITYAGIYTFRGDKIVELNEYATRDEALRAVLGD